MTDLEEKLYKVYDDANSLLRFAEAKNIGLIAFNAGVLIGMTKLIIDFTDDLLWLIVFSYIAIFNLVSILMAFMSIMPQLKHKESDLEIFNSDNLTWIGSIANCKPEDFLDKFKTRYGFVSQNLQYENDLARQIVIVSQIAIRKMKYFKRACLVTLWGIGSPLAALAYKLFSDHNK